MDLIAGIKDRRSVRSFLEKDVSNDLLIQILEVARFAPSGVNTQPWHVAIVSKPKRDAIGQAIIAAKDAEIDPNPDYQYYPLEWREPYKTRRKACGLALYGALNIAYDEKEKRKAAWYRNYHFFHAPAGMLFFLDADMEKGSWLDMGMFLQNVMLAARGFGLETCPQAALSEYPDLVKEIVGFKDKHLVCGMALGYEDKKAPINHYRTEREDLDSFVVFV